jgi:hypothetical protein
MQLSAPPLKAVLSTVSAHHTAGTLPSPQRVVQGVIQPAAPSVRPKGKSESLETTLPNSRSAVDSLRTAPQGAAQLHQRESDAMPSKVRTSSKHAFVS